MYLKSMPGVEMYRLGSTAPLRYCYNLRVLLGVRQEPSETELMSEMKAVEEKNRDAQYRDAV